MGSCSINGGAFRDPEGFVELCTATTGSSLTANSSWTCTLVGNYSQLCRSGNRTTQCEQACRRCCSSQGTLGGFTHQG